MSNQLGNYIREKRGKTSLREFAARCGISHTHLDTIEKGYDPRTLKRYPDKSPARVQPSLDVLKKIAAGIGEDVEYLIILEMEDNKNNSESEIALKVSESASPYEISSTEITDILNQKTLTHHGKQLSESDIEKLKKALDLILWE
ncbi:MAG: helix-turn-helix transcriptional regulator [Sporomusaceae bacterium]|nr:helix-turn-helix transcriptional regulator [Sporomusaceae bacterium]